MSKEIPLASIIRLYDFTISVILLFGKCIYDIVACLPAGRGCLNILVDYTTNYYLLCIFQLKDAHLNPRLDHVRDILFSGITTHKPSNVQNLSMVVAMET